MGDIPRPSGADGMLDPGGWTDASESRFYQVAQDCLSALNNLVNRGLTPWDRTHKDTFKYGGGAWSGDAAGAGNQKGNTLIQNFTELQNLLTAATNWNYELSQTVVGAKTSVTNNVSAALDYISKLSQDDPDYETKVRDKKAQCLQANVRVIESAANAVTSPQTFKPQLSGNQLLAAGLPSGPPTGVVAPIGGGPSTPPNAPKSGNTGELNQAPQPTPTNNTTPTPPTGTSAPASSQAPQPSKSGNTGELNQVPREVPKTTPIPAPATSQPADFPKSGNDGVLNQPSNPVGTPGGTQTANSQNLGGTSNNVVGLPPAATTRTTSGGGGGGTPTASTSTGGSASGGGLGSTTSGSGTPQSGNPTGQPTGAQAPGGQPNNPLQQGLQQFGQGLQSGAGNTSQPLAAAQPATQQPTTPPPATPTGAAGGTSGTSAAPVGAASAAGGGGSVGGPAAATPAAPAAPLGPAPTPSPAAPVSQPGQGGPVGPTGPGVAAAGTSNQQAAAAAAPIPVSPARAERDAMAAAAKAGLLQRKSAGNTDADIEIARRISAALHAPPSIPAASYQFVWAVGVTSEGQILAANSYGIGYIPDGVKLPGQVTLVSADEAISPAERGRWVNVPFLALQGWAQFHGKTLRAIIGTPDEVKPYKSSMHAEELAPDDIPADGTMQGRSRLQVIAPEAAARLEEWSDVTLYEALPPRPVQDAPPDAKQTMKLWVETIKPLLRTTGTNGPVDHLTKLIAYADHMQSIELYKAYTAPHVAAQREAMSDWIYWQHVSSICQDATNPVLGSVQA